jgi:hypothetical protein
MNQQHPMPVPVAGQPFPPFCEFGVCLAEEPHTPECRTHAEQPEAAEEEFPLPY